MSPTTGPGLHPYRAFTSHLGRLFLAPLMLKHARHSATTDNGSRVVYVWLCKGAPEGREGCW